MARTGSPKKRRILTDKVREPEPGLWSNCFLVGDQLFIAGMVAWDSEHNLVGSNDPYAQSVQAFENMKAYTEAAGGTMGDIVRITCYLTDIRHRPAFLEARREYFTGDFPAAIVIGNVTLANTNLLVEIDAWGFIGAGET